MTATQLNLQSPLPRIGMVSTHGYVAAEPPLGAAAFLHACDELEADPRHAGGG